MRIFSASLKNEFKKLSARKKYFVFLIIEAIICLISAGFDYLLGKASGGVMQSVVLGSMQMNLLGFFVYAYIPLVIFMAACDLFSGEYHDGTIRATFMRPVSRAKQYFSKVTALVITAFVYLGVLLALTTVIGAVGAGTLSGLIESLPAYLLDLVPMVILALFAAMVCQISNSPSLSIILCIIVYIAMMVLGILIPQLSGCLFTGYMQWHNIWMGTTLPFGSLITKMGILLGYGMIFGCVGYYLFERKEV